MTEDREQIEREAASVEVFGDMSWSVSGFVITEESLKTLEGQLLTQLEASIGEHTQREALKSIARRMLWSWYEEATKNQPVVRVTWSESGEKGNEPMVEVHLLTPSSQGVGSKNT